MSGQKSAFFSFSKLRIYCLISIVIRLSFIFLKFIPFAFELINVIPNRFYLQCSSLFSLRLNSDEKISIFTEQESIDKLCNKQNTHLTIDKGISDYYFYEFPDTDFIGFFYEKS